MIIDNIPVAINGEKNLLELIRKAGIELPTFCYYSELSVYGACRMCMVENKWGGMEAACSTPPRNGMEIYTNTPRLRKYRKMILELLLSNHCGECTTCDKNGKCKLQELAARFDIHRIRFDNPKSKPCIDDSSVSITRDANKCILCGDCVRVCNEVQNVGAIDFAFRGSKMKVACSFDKPIGDSNCVGCGQCAAVCPTGAIIIKNDSHRLWKELNQEDTIAVAQVAPAVRVAVAKEFGYNGENVMGKIVAALRRIGFNYIFDTSTAADLTVMEESKEFADRLANGGKLPLFTSCCPAWIKYAENEYPEILPNISTCRSPMQMFASVINEKFKGEFTNADRVLLTALHDRLLADPKLAKLARSSDPQIFTESIFPKAFDTAAQDSYLEAQDTFSSLFEDTSKYKAIMSALAEWLYGEFRKK